MQAHANFWCLPFLPFRGALGSGMLTLPCQIGNPIACLEAQWSRPAQGSSHPGHPLPNQMTNHDLSTTSQTTANLVKLITLVPMIEFKGLTRPTNHDSRLVGQLVNTVTIVFTAAWRGAATHHSHLYSVYGARCGDVIHTSAWRIHTL